QNLCAALQRSFSDETIWVYYARSPLVPYLRSAELQQLDCAIPLPEERLAHAVPGQEIWHEAARRLVGTTESPQDTNGQEAIRDLLTRIGGEDFAQIRRAPPLLYHQAILGDSVNAERFYWSDDVGYVLWLR